MSRAGSAVMRPSCRSSDWPACAAPISTSAAAFVASGGWKTVFGGFRYIDAADPVSIAAAFSLKTMGKIGR